MVVENAPSQTVRFNCTIGLGDLFFSNGGLCFFLGGSDSRQWEYISYCLSQLTFNEKGIKKLMELFKTYEQVLFEDSMMDNFRNIVRKAKKLAKPELKSCIEEFEEKFVKFHIDKKEQQCTAKNAQTHQKSLIA